jgi:hypothetical protein
MPFIGNKPSAVPLTSADIADGIITSAKIVDATITNSDVASSIITGQTAETSIAGGDSVLIYDDSASALRKMTRTNFVAGVGGTNTPYFRAERTTNQSTTTYVGTKIQFNTVTFDSASGFDNSTNYRYTIPSGQDGYWLIQLSMGTYFSSNNGGAFNLDLRKNGSTVQTSANVTVDSGTSIYRHRNQTITAILNLSAADYLEGYGMLVGTTPAIRGDANETFLQGFRLVQ